MTAYYAIRHKPTGRFMPETRKGYSYWNPADLNGGYTPRLFTTRRGAANALTCWLQGQFTKLREIESCSWEYPSYEVDAGTHAEPVADRKRDEMEVVFLKLRFVKT